MTRKLLVWTVLTVFLALIGTYFAYSNAQAGNMTMFALDIGIIFVNGMTLGLAFAHRCLSK